MIYKVVNLKNNNAFKLCRGSEELENVLQDCIDLCEDVFDFHYEVFIVHSDDSETELDINVRTVLEVGNIIKMNIME